MGGKMTKAFIKILEDLLHMVKSCIFQQTWCKDHSGDNLKEITTTSLAVTGRIGTARLAGTQLITEKRRLISSAGTVIIRSVWYTKSPWCVSRVCWASRIRFSIIWTPLTRNSQKSRRSTTCSKSLRKRDRNEEYIQDLRVLTEPKAVWGGNLGGLIHRKAEQREIWRLWQPSVGNRVLKQKGRWGTCFLIILSYTKESFCCIFFYQFVKTLSISKDILPLINLQTNHSTNLLILYTINHPFVCCLCTMKTGKLQQKQRP